MFPIWHHEEQEGPASPGDLTNEGKKKLIFASLLRHVHTRRMELIPPPGDDLAVDHSANDILHRRTCCLAGTSKPSKIQVSPRLTSPEQGTAHEEGQAPNLLNSFSFHPAMLDSLQ